MLKLLPVLSTKIWGYEQWIASTHPNGMQKDFHQAVGGDYPLLVKIIQADARLSVQVHPDDNWAKKLETPDSRGKTECWYVLDAKPDAQLVYGLNGIYSEKELRTAIERNQLEDYLRYVPVHTGDFIYIPAGTVHAIGGGMRLLEVQQSCDITYRLYDWGRGRELHIDKALKVINNSGMRNVGPFPGEFECQYFSLEDVAVKNGGYSMFASKGSEPSLWQLLFAVSGEGKVKSSLTPEVQDIHKEDIFAVAPGEKVTVEGSIHLMRIRCK